MHKVNVTFGTNKYAYMIYGKGQCVICDQYYNLQEYIHLCTYTLHTCMHIYTPTYI